MLHNIRGDCILDFILRGELYHGPEFDLNTYWTSSSSRDINKMQFNVGNDEIVEVDIVEDFDIIDEDPAV